jgi:hypothetical protein
MIDSNIVTTLSAIPGVGHYMALVLPWLGVAVALAAVSARFFPPPAKTTGFYAAAYYLVNWAAQNRGHASNATAPAARPVSPSLNTLGPIAFLLAPTLMLLACTDQHAAAQAA